MTWNIYFYNNTSYRLELVIGEKYKMIKKVGSGAFGEIYKGIHNHYFLVPFINIITIGVNTKTGEEVAIKLVKSISIINKLHIYRNLQRQSIPSYTMKLNYIKYLMEQVSYYIICLNTNIVGLPKLYYYN